MPAHLIVSPIAWIDYRASVARAWRRKDVGEHPELCLVCGTEVDVRVPAHSPRCKAGV